MFAAHLAVALAAKRLAPRASLGTLAAAAQLQDLVWPVLLLAGVEVVRIERGATAASPLDFVRYPFSHSAVAALAWAAAAGLLHRWRARDRAGTWTVAGLVASHWLLDALAHRPDLPTWPGGPLAGLGLWGSRPATVAVEGALLAAGALLYGRTTRAADPVGRFGFLGFLGLVALIAAGNLLGPPPPSDTAVAVAGLGLWLLVAAAAWIDRHRVVRETIDRPAAEL